MWPLHPEQDNQYKLVDTLFMITWMHVSDAQWLRSFVKESIEASDFWQESIDFHKFHIKGAMFHFDVHC